MKGPKELVEPVGKRPRESKRANDDAVDVELRLAVCERANIAGDGEHITD